VVHPASPTRRSSDLLWYAPSMPRPVRERHVPTRTTQRREELIERLIDVFLDEGFADTSIEDLAHALRCSKSTLYAVAASKEQIRSEEHTSELQSRQN